MPRLLLRHLLAAASLSVAICVTVGGSLALAWHEPMVGVPVWEAYPSYRWVVYVDRSSCGVGRVRWVDLNALPVSEADRWLRPRGTDWAVAGFRYDHRKLAYIETVAGPRRPGDARYRGIVAYESVRVGVPVLAVVPLSAVPPVAFWWRTFRRRRRRRAGLCVACGYDCRMSADRCPECGTGTPCRVGT